MIEELRAALAALEAAGAHFAGNYTYRNHVNAVTDLKAVIAEMEAGERSLELKFSKAAADQGFTLVPLTDEQIEAVWVEQGLDDCDPHGFARAIEAAHGITAHLTDVEGGGL